MNKENIQPVRVSLQNPLVPTCAEIEPHLLAYWTHADIFDMQSLVLIRKHLIEDNCQNCQQTLSQVMEKEKAPWQQ